MNPAYPEAAILQKGCITVRPALYILQELFNNMLIFYFAAMLIATVVTTTEELKQIHRLNSINLKQNVTDAEKKAQGFVTWLYSMELLQQMHQLQASIIVKDGDKVAGYALVTPREAGPFHHDLQTMMDNLATLSYNGRPLNDYSWYVMGQVCIDKAYRGMGVFDMLYRHHQKLYASKYNLLITEISTSNRRSIKAHKRVGFRELHVYKDLLDEWSVVVWDWNKS
ncbi:GNAT family N-acetyltransferase [Foetidibacter luteolus]|uniref:GNAT family N-acetyltransferase n=1 Tax=Foetidibacter luteolus TaxID=2608880 RepID=UPI001A97E6B5|nr:GNAT family N-acetyltransferase [Foetidibacter luteolus]